MVDLIIEVYEEIGFVFVEKLCCVKRFYINFDVVIDGLVYDSSWVV